MQDNIVLIAERDGTVSYLDTQKNEMLPPFFGRSVTIICNDNMRFGDRDGIVTVVNKENNRIIDQIYPLGGYCI